MTTAWYKSPLVWSFIIVGILSSVYQMEEKDSMDPVVGTYAPPPITRRQIRDSLRHQSNSVFRTRNYQRGRNINLYEVELYVDGKWIKVSRAKIRNLPSIETEDWEEVYDQVEGK